MNEKRPLSVLIAPLDWGLGHATRCIPMIKEFVTTGAAVTVAASGRQRSLLLQEFPLMEFIDIPGYDISFRKGVLVKWGLLLRLRKILKKIKQEENWLDNILENRNFDLVISDNRYGLFTEKAFCIFITHQLAIQSGWSSTSGDGRWRLAVGRWVDHQILKWNYRLIEKFSACWIPDWEGENSIAGSLSHPSRLPKIPVKYIGILSRMRSSDIHPQEDSVLVLLSGPEPYRTEFESILFTQLPACSKRIIVVRGLPGSDASIAFTKNNAVVYNHVPAEVLNHLLDESEIIITRSGYSTIMDLVTKKKSAILVPTPGQTEQEYLAAYMQEKKWMYYIPQKDFNLTNALSAFQNMEKQIPATHDSELHNVIKELLVKVSERSQPD